MNLRGTLEAFTPLGHLALAGRWDPEYFDPDYIEIERMLRGRNAQPLGDHVTFIIRSSTPCSTSWAFPRRTKTRSRAGRSFRLKTPSVRAG